MTVNIYGCEDTKAISIKHENYDLVVYDDFDYAITNYLQNSIFNNYTNILYVGDIPDRDIVNIKNKTLTIITTNAKEPTSIIAVDAKQYAGKLLTGKCDNFQECVEILCFLSNNDTELIRINFEYITSVTPITPEVIEQLVPNSYEYKPWHIWSMYKKYDINGLSVAITPDNIRYVLNYFLYRMTNDFDSLSDREKLTYNKLLQLKVGKYTTDKLKYNRTLKILFDK